MLCFVLKFLKFVSVLSPAWSASPCRCSSHLYKFRTGSFRACILLLHGAGSFEIFSRAVDQCSRCFFHPDLLPFFECLFCLCFWYLSFVFIGFLPCVSVTPHNRHVTQTPLSPQDNELACCVFVPPEVSSSWVPSFCFHCWLAAGLSYFTTLFTLKYHKIQVYTCPVLLNKYNKCHLIWSIKVNTS